MKGMGGSASCCRAAWFCSEGAGKAELRVPDLLCLLALYARMVIVMVLGHLIKAVLPLGKRIRGGAIHSQPGKS